MAVIGKRIPSLGAIPTLVERQDELPDLGPLSAESVESLGLHAVRLDELQALVDDDRQTVAGQLLLLQWDS